MIYQISKSPLIRSNYEVIECEPDQKFIEGYYNNSESSWRKKVDCLDYGSFIPFRKLRESEISLLYKHWIILKKVCESDHEYSLVLEDDILISGDFDDKLRRVVDGTKNDWDFIFLGNGCGLRIPSSRIRKGKYSYAKSNPASKCTDSFLIKKNSAKKILGAFDNFSLPIDFEFNYNMYMEKMKVYWSEPPIVEQGSQNEKFKSAI